MSSTPEPLEEGESSVDLPEPLEEGEYGVDWPEPLEEVESSVEQEFLPEYDSDSSSDSDEEENLLDDEIFISSIINLGVLTRVGRQIRSLRHLLE